MDLPKLIAVIHLPNLRKIALEKRVDILVDYVEKEVREVEESGFESVIVENFGDAPYPKRVVEPEVLGLISIAVYVARKAFHGVIGLNILRCSAVEAYRLAYALGAKFIRVNAFVETLVTDSGLIESSAPSLAELRYSMPGIAVFGDILCKHSGSLDILTRLFTKYVQELGKSSLDDIVKDVIKDVVMDAVERGGVDVVVVTGGRTGYPPSIEFVKFVKNIAMKPVYVGSGINPQNLCEYLRVCDGIIVGSYIKKNGKAGNPTDRERAKKIVEKFKECSSVLQREVDEL